MGRSWPSEGGGDKVGESSRWQEVCLGHLQVRKNGKCQGSKSYSLEYIRETRHEWDRHPKFL